MPALPTSFPPRPACLALLLALAPGVAHAGRSAVTFDTSLKGAWSQGSVVAGDQACATFGVGASKAFATRFGAAATLTWGYTLPGASPQALAGTSPISVGSFKEGVEQCFTLPTVSEGVPFSLYALDEKKALTAMTSNQLALSRGTATATTGGTSGSTTAGTPTTTASSTTVDPAAVAFDAEVKKRIVAAAQTWVLQNQAEIDRNHQDSGQPWNSPVGLSRVRIYLLPDGKAAAPLPVDLAEADRIEVWVLMPTPDFLVRNGIDLAWRDYTVSFTACPGRDRNRVRGGLTTVNTFLGSVQAAREVPVVTPADLAPYRATPVRCGAGDVTFTTETVFGKANHTLKLSKVYRLTVGLQYTFDMTRTGALEVRLDADGAATIARNEDMLGLALAPVFIYHPFGYNPDRGSILGTVLGPTLGLDMGGITDSFYFGDTLCFARGVCLGLGAHVRKVQQMDPSTGLTVGDAWTGETPTLTTVDAWTWDGDPVGNGGIGFYVGLTIDSATLGSILNGG